MTTGSEGGPTPIDKLDKLRDILGRGGYHTERPISYPEVNLWSVDRYYVSHRLVLEGFECPSCGTARVFLDAATPTFCLKDSFVFCNNCGSGAWYPSVIQRVFQPGVEI